MLKERKKELELIANDIRQDILRSTHSAKTGHPGGSLSSTEIITYLYNQELNIDPKNPDNPDRDRFVLSKGHVAPVLYAALAHRGFFPVEDLITLRHIDSYLQGHPNMNTTPGIDMSTGSLGQGISTAVGMAEGAKLLNKDLKVYTLLGDGEVTEGQVWEALLFASHYNLDNLCVIVDVNGLQIDGRTEDVMNTKPLDKKFEAFGFDVVEIDGHDLEEIEKGFIRFNENQGSKQPTAILMDTIKGKGVSFMEDQAGWHGKAPNDDELEMALAELVQARQVIMEEE